MFIAPMRANQMAGIPVISKYYHYWYKKITFSLHCITLYLLSFKSSVYSLVRESDFFNNTKGTWFIFILMLSDQNGISSKYQPGYFNDLHLLLTWYFMSILKKKNKPILLAKDSPFLIESSYFYWEFYQGFC